ncbi:MAG: hypothetical protein M1820_001810 [Bogoriella megaspora]|nr:MAG: hypothetical protein M1820_001810 [Bogoriella megaspora]
MSATSVRTQLKPSGVPFSQNTAPVVEFRCLYTHDVRRKSKRWQDGFVKFHTFNKRIMVYDVPRNFIGDTHWTDPAELQEGDEVTLESAVLVQVSEAVDRTETDLSPLFQKKTRNSAKEQQDTNNGTRKSANLQDSRANVRSQAKHKSLYALLGESQGPYGKATIPTKSPYEIRSSDAENEWEEGPDPKRRKQNDAPREWSIVQTTKTPKRREEPLRMQAAKARKSGPSPMRNTGRGTITSPGQSTFNVKTVIDISSDTDIPSSDGPLPGPTMPPPQNRNRVEEVQFSRSAVTRRVPTSAPRTGNNRETAEETVPLRASSPPVSTTNKVNKVANPERPREAVRQIEDGIEEEERVGKPLRFSKKASRNMLICQELPKRGKTSKEINRPLIDCNTEETAIDSPLRKSKKSRKEEQPERPTSPKESEADRLRERLSKIKEKKAKRRRKSLDEEDNDTLCENNLPPLNISAPTSDLFGTSSLTLSQLDQAFLFPQTIPNELSKPQSVNQEPPHPQHRSFNRVQSENDKPPNPQSRPFRRVQSEPNNPPNAASKTTTANLNHARAKADLESNVLRQPYHPPRRGERRVAAEENSVHRDADTGPWSKEAFDLFDWRPPNFKTDMEIGVGV